MEPIQKQQAPIQEQTPQFPTEEVTLPSKGLLYPEGSPLKFTLQTEKSFSIKV